MKEPLFDVILEGTIKAGADRGTVVAGLASLFKKDPQVAEKLLAASPRALKKGLDRETAEKYRKLIERVGAVARIEEEGARDADAYAEGLEAISGPHPVDAVQAAPQPEPGSAAMARATTAASLLDLECPRCHYRPTSEDDVMLVRGDCPKCGLLVRTDLGTDLRAVEEEEPPVVFRRPEDVYQGLTPASWKRRTLAAFCNFNLFLVLYAGFVLLFLFLFVPLRSLPAEIGQRFLVAVLAAFPMLTIAMTVIIMCFVLPIFNAGRSWGQSTMEIEVLFTTEAQDSGLYFSLGLRTGAILAITLVPGWFVLWLGSWVTLFYHPWAQLLVIVVLAAISWAVAGLYAKSRPDQRGILDRAAGTIQIERAPLRDDAKSRVIQSLFAAVGLWMVFGIVLPLLLKLIFR